MANQNPVAPSQVVPPTVALASQLPAKVVSKLVDGLRHGMTLRQACDLAQAPYATVKAWMVPTENDPLPVIEFRRLLRQAMAEVAYNDLQAVSAATFGDWKAAAWRLSRMFKNQWGEQKLPTTQISVDQTQIAMQAGQTGGVSLTQNPWSAVLQQNVPASPTNQPAALDVAHEPVAAIEPAIEPAIDAATSEPNSCADPFAV